MLLPSTIGRTTVGGGYSIPVSCAHTMLSECRHCHHHWRKHPACGEQPCQVWCDEWPRLPPYWPSSAEHQHGAWTCIAVYVQTITAVPYSSWSWKYSTAWADSEQPQNNNKKQERREEEPPLSPSRHYSYPQCTAPNCSQRLVLIAVAVVRQDIIRWPTTERYKEPVKVFIAVVLKKLKYKISHYLH